MYNLIKSNQMLKINIKKMSLIVYFTAIYRTSGNFLYKNSILYKGYLGAKGKLSYSNRFEKCWVQTQLAPTAVCF